MSLVSSLLAMLLVFGAATAGAASFDCARAGTRVEKTICASPRLSWLDEALGHYYAAVRQELPAARGCLADDEAHWLHTVRDACTDAACLKTAYLRRLAALDAIQPGATALKHVELPAVPSLVWIIPASRDRVAAPPRPNAKPLVARGRLLADLQNGDGIELRSDAGANALLVPLMFLDPRITVHLEALAADRQARYEARGFRARDDDGRTVFEPSRCVFLYRLP